MATAAPAAPVQRKSVSPTLGLLPILAVSAAVTGAPASAQAVVELDPVTIEGADPSAEARESYLKSRAASDKMTAPLLDTPKTVTIITQKQIEERGATSLNDVLRTTPGVTLGTGEGGTPLGDRPFIRGFEASTDIAVDGLRTLGRSSYESFNLESVEITKGPGGAYSGRGSTGGSINMTTKAPVEGETFQRVTAGAGTGDQKRATYDGNFALSDTVDARLNLQLQDSGVPGRDVLRDKRIGFAPSISARIGDASKVTLSLYHYRTEGTPDLGLPIADSDYNNGGAYGIGTPDNPYVPLKNVDRTTFYGSAKRDFRNVENNIATLKFEHDFSSSLKMTSTLSYIQTEQEYIVTRPEIVAGRAVQRLSRQGKRLNETLAFGTNFQTEFQTGNVEHDLSFGFEFSREELRSGNVTGVPTLGNSDLFNPNSWETPTGGPAVFGPYGDPTTTTTKSLYAFNTMTFSPQWLVNLGLRLDNYHLDAPASGSTPALSRDDTMLNYQLGVMYKPVENATIYASISTASEPAGQCRAQAGGTGGACANADTDPEKSKSYEVGAKWDMAGGLSLSAAVFKTVKDNQRTTDAVTGEWEMVGSSEAKGFELGAAGNITDKWQIYAGYTYLDARLVSGGDSTANDGKRLFNTARDSFSLWTSYAVTDQWTLGGGATYVGKRYTNNANTAALPASWRVDLMTSYEFNDQASLRLNVNNVFDEVIFDSAHQGLFATVQPARNAMLTFDYKF